MLVRTRPWIKIKGLTNWEIIEQGIMEKRLKAGKISEQHFTTTCKLYTSRNHLTKLGKKIPTKRITDLPIKIIEVEQKNVKIEYLASFETRAEEYLEDFDGFFYSLRGCLD